MTMKDLSKKAKYIYRVYCAADDVVHVEKYPVIYVNKMYLYYKVPGDEYLHCVGMKLVNENIESVDSKCLGRGMCFDFLLWNPAGVDQVTAIKLRNKLNMRANEERVRREEEIVERYRRYYEEHFKTLEALKKLRLEYGSDESVGELSE